MLSEETGFGLLQTLYLPLQQQQQASKLTVPDETLRADERKTLRKNRTKFNSFQVATLEALFQRNDRLNFRKMIPTIAKEIGEGPDTVRVWFKNRNAKEGKTSPPPGADSDQKPPSLQVDEFELRGAKETREEEGTSSDQITSGGVSSSDQMITRVISSSYQITTRVVSSGEEEGSTLHLSFASNAPRGIGRAPVGKSQALGEKLTLGEPMFLSNKPKGRGRPPKAKQVVQQATKEEFDAKLLQQEVHILFSSEVEFRIKAKNVDIDGNHFQQMVASLWSALPLAERAKYERKAEQNLQQKKQNVQNVQNVEEESRGGESEAGEKVEERGKSERVEERIGKMHNWQVNSIAEQEMPPGEGDNFCKAAVSPLSSPAPSPPSASSPAPSPPSTSSPAPALPTISSPAKGLIGDSQPYCIFYSELRQVVERRVPSGATSEQVENVCKEMWKRMKPSYREHYVNLALEQNRTKSLISDQLCTRSDAAAPGNFSGESAVESNNIGSEDCSVNVFEDGTILEDVHGEAGGKSPSNASHPSFLLDQQTMTGEEEMEEEEEEEVVEEVEHVEEGDKKENDDEEEAGLGETEKDEKGDEEEDGLVAKEEIIKEEELELERQDRDPLDVEVSDGKTGQEQMMKSSNLDETLVLERTRVETDALIVPLVERKMRGETLIEGRKGETEEEVAARELDEATLSIADPGRGESPCEVPDDVTTEPRMKILAPPTMTVEEADRVVVKYDGDVEGGLGGGGDEEDGNAMEEEERGKDERVLEGKMEVGEARETVGDLYIIKDEIDVEDSIILSDLEYDLTDEDGEDGEDEEGEKPLKNEQCNVSRSSEGASALGNMKEREYESSLKKAALDERRKDKEYESSMEKAAIGKTKEKEFEGRLKKAPLDKSKQKVFESSFLKKTAVEKKKEKDSERSLKDVLEKQWSNSGMEKSDETGKEISNSEKHNLEDDDLQSLIKYLVTKKRPDKETIKKIVSLTRTKLSKLEEMEVDIDEKNKNGSKGETESGRVISELEARMVVSRAEPSKATSKVEPRRVISKKSASELKSEIILTMKRNAEEHENEVRRAAKVLRRTENEEEGGTGDVGTEWTSMRREEEEMKIRDASQEQEKKLRTEHLLKNGKVDCKDCQLLMVEVKRRGELVTDMAVRIQTLERRLANTSKL